LGMSDKDLSGRQLGNYQVIERVGKGGMATVYRAHELSLNRMVALKVLSPHLSDDPGFIKRFEREAQAAAGLNHPNIVQIYSIGEEDGVHFIAMEFVKGRTLADIVREEGHVAVDRALEIIRQAAEALGEAHRAGLVHRDIKPGNIIVHENGRVKVTDFGIAFIPEADTKLTRDGAVIGTPEYISPEQCRSEPVDGRSDIYSLGVTLYEMLAGRTPYTADTPVSMLMKIVQGEFLPLGEVSPGVPEGIRSIVGRMMASDPADRYQTADELIRDIDNGGIADIPGTPPIPEVAALPPPVPDAGPPPPIPPGPAPEQPSAPLPGKEKEPTVPPEPAVTKTPGYGRSFVLAGILVVVAVAGAFGTFNYYEQKRVSEEVAVLQESVETVAFERDDRTQATESPEGAASPSSDGTLTETAYGHTGTTQPGNGNGADGGPPDGALDSTPDATSGGNLFVENTADIPEPGDDPFADSRDQKGAADVVSVSKQAETTSSGYEGDAGVSSPLRRSVQESRNVANVGPPPNTVIVTSTGNSHEAELAGSFVEEALSRTQLDVRDRGYYGAQPLKTVAQYECVVTVHETGAMTLNYYGRQSELMTASVSAKMVDTRSGRVVAGPVSRTVKYTSLNVEENLRTAAEELAWELEGETIRSTP